MLEQPEYITLALEDEFCLDIALCWVPSENCLDYAAEMVNSGVIKAGTYIILSYGEFEASWEYRVSQ